MHTRSCQFALYVLLLAKYNNYRDRCFTGYEMQIRLRCISPVMVVAAGFAAYSIGFLQQNGQIAGQRDVYDNFLSFCARHNHYQLIISIAWYILWWYTRFLSSLRSLHAATTSTQVTIPTHRICFCRLLPD